MTKNEFMTRLRDELQKRNVSDAADIAEEYEQHFAFKLADGRSEEEIAAKLGDPADVAAQFGEDGGEQHKTAAKQLITAGMFLLDAAAALLFVLLAAWGIVMATACIVCLALAIGLLTGLDIYGLIPVMPYACGALMAVVFAALGVLTAVGSVYYAAFLRQLVRAFVRFQRNVLAAASGKAVLPKLAVRPQLSAKRNSRLRSTALVSLTIFAAFFVLSYVVCSLTAGGLQFWHVWGWFGYAG